MGCECRRPRPLAQTRAGSDGGFDLRSDATPAGDVSLYLTATGGVPIGKTNDDNAARRRRKFAGTRHRLAHAMVAQANSGADGRRLRGHTETSTAILAARLDVPLASRPFVSCV